MTDKNRQWLLNERPQGPINDNTFRLETAAMPALPNGGVVLKTLYLSFDPAMRGWMDDVPSYLPPVPLNEPMRASAVAQVIESDNTDLPKGTLVMGMLSWQEYCACDAATCATLNALPAGTPPAMALSSFGITGITAYFGFLDVGQPKAGETVLVSGAAGATGSVVCQIAKLKGCRVIGIAGSDEKCSWLTDTCGVDATINYRTEDLTKRIGELAPDGVDIFFDNVGADTLEAGLWNMADFGRIVLCGSIASYNDAEPRPGPRNMFIMIKRRIRMQGFVLLDYLDRIDEAQAEIGEWVMSGKIHSREDIQEGFENIPATLNRLFDGKNIGKQLLRLADPE